MKSKVKEAVAKKEQGYNCAQAVLCTYCQEFGVSETEGYQLSEALGTGISGLQEVCGAFSAVSLLIGLKNSDGILCSKETRPKTYQLTQEASKAFIKQCHHLLCKEIIHDLDENGKRLVPCEECVRTGAEIIEAILRKA